MKENEQNKKKFTSKIIILLINIYSVFIINNNKNNKIKTKICLCTIGKKENLYIKEFVLHYKKLGFNHIFLYDNNDKIDEIFEDVIKTEIEDGFVSIINYRGYRGKRNNPQLDSYYDCYNKNYKTYNWLSFFDIDEYLILKDNLTINEFLNKKVFKKCQSIKINWLTFSDNELYHYENNSLKDRFKIESKYINENIHIKSIVRGNLSINYWYNASNVHSSNNNKFFSCTSSGKRTSSTNYYHIPIDYKFAFIKHYVTKTIEEYAEKIKKGIATYNFKYLKKNIQIRLDYFFKINNKNQIKLNIFNKAFNTTFK